MYYILIMNLHVNFMEGNGSFVNLEYHDKALFLIVPKMCVGKRKTKALFLHQNSLFTFSKKPLFERTT